MSQLRRLLFALGAMMAVLGLLLAAAAQGSAQTAAPAKTPVPGAFPDDLHKGSCQRPVAQPDFRLGNAGPPTDSSGKVVAIQGIETGPPLLEAAATGAFNLTNVLKSGQAYVILVHQSAQNYATYLACGEVAGPLVNNQLAVALRPLNNAAYAGVATLSPNGDSTGVTTYLISDLTALTGGKVTGTVTPGPTPAGAQSAFTPTPAPTPPPTPTMVPPSPTPSPTPTKPAVVQVTATPKPTPKP